VNGSGGVQELGGGKVTIDRPAEAVARLTIANPDKRNAMDHDILDAIATAVPTLADGIETRCLILTGAGKVFSAGYDIGDIPDEVFAEEAERLVAHPFSRAIQAVEAFPFPTLAAINGHALGGGLELALTCDLRLASEEAKLGMPPARLGLVYSHTGLRRFLDTIGAARTRELFFTARNVNARTGLQWGLVNEVVAPGDLAAHAVAFAARIAANAPLSLAGNKRALRELLRAEGALDPDIERELVELREACFGTEDFFEGVRAFAEKRSPRWQGR
jgi:enoyl-CoA hydratase/carnithine racemase